VSSGIIGRVAAPVPGIPRGDVAMLVLSFLALMAFIAPFVLDYHFTGDDYEVIRGAQISPFPIDGDFRVVKQGAYFRPLVTLSFALNGWLSPGQPWSYHLFNLLLHALNALFVSMLMTQLFATRGRIAAFTGFVFFLLPQGLINAWWIVGRTDLLYTTGMLAACLSALMFLRTASVRWLSVMALMLLVSLLSKESAVLTLVYLMVCSGIVIAGSEDRSIGKRISAVFAVAVPLVIAYLGYRMALFGSISGNEALLPAFYPARGARWMFHGVASLLAPVDPVDSLALWYRWWPGVLLLALAVLLYISAIILAFTRAQLKRKRETAWLFAAGFLSLVIYVPTFPSTRLAYGIMPFLLLPAVLLLAEQRGAKRFRALAVAAALVLFLVIDATLLWKFHLIGAWNQQVERLNASVPESDSVYVLAQIGRVGQTVAETAMPVWQPLSVRSEAAENSTREVFVLGRFEGNVFTDWNKPYTIRAYGDTVELISSDELSGFVPVMEMKFASLDPIVTQGIVMEPLAFSRHRGGVLSRVRFHPVPSKMVPVMHYSDGRFRSSSVVDLMRRYRQR